MKTMVFRFLVRFLIYEYIEVSVIFQDAHYSEEIASNDEHGQMADKFVKSLIESKIVYRTFRMPLGNASLPPNQAFSIRGYFIPAVGPGYQFITHTPLRQHWMVCPDVSILYEC